MILDRSNFKQYNISSAILNYVAFNADTLQMTRPADGAAPFRYGQEITLMDGSRTLFSGRVDDVRTSINGSSKVDSITVLGWIGWLGRITYSETRGDVVYGYTEYIGGSTTDEGTMKPLDTLLEIPFDYANLPLSLDAETGLSTPDYLPSGQESCHNIMVSMSRLTPSLMAWVDYGARAWRWRRVDTLSTVSSIDARLTSLDLQARHDLSPPSVCLTGGVQYNVGGSPSEIDAYVYHVPESAMTSAGYAGIQQSAQAANRQRSILRGAVLPKSYFVYGESPGAKGLDIALSSDAGKKILKFWGHFAAFKGLAGIADIVKVGSIFVDLVPDKELYPENEDLPPEEQDKDLAIPYNYQMPTENPVNWQTVAVLVDGSFPASENQKQCLFGLRWCKAIITQYAYVASSPTEETDIAALNRLFPSRGQVYISDEDGYEERQLSKFTIEGAVLINRAKKSYYPIDLGLSSSDPDYDDYSPEVEDYPEFPTEEQLKSWAQQYYRDTRRVPYDGSINYCDYNDDPRIFMGTKLQVEGMPVASPVQRVRYDLFNRTLQLSVGSSTAMNIDERISRYQATRTAELAALAANDNPAPRQAGKPLDEGDMEALQPTTISPQLSATISAAPKLEQDVPQFSVYWRDGKPWFKGGSKMTETGVVTLADLDISAYYKPGQNWFVEEVIDPSTRSYYLAAKFSNP